MNHPTTVSMPKALRTKNLRTKYHSLSSIAIASLVLTLNACAPIPPSINGLSLEKPISSAQQASDQAMRIAPHSEWWKDYQDAQLDNLVLLALANSPNLQITQARLLQAQATANMTQANGGMALTAGVDATRQKFSANYIYPPPLGGAVWNSADALLSLTTNFDWWGKNRLQISAAIGQVKAQQAEDREAANSLSAAVVKVYFQWQWQQARQELLEKIVAETRQLASINQKRISAGLEASGTKESLLAEIAAAEQEIIRCKTLQQQAQVQLQALLGNTAQVPKLTPRALPIKTVQTATEINLDAIANRPDVMAAQAQAASTQDLIKADKTNFYPNINITALVGYSSFGFANLFKSSSFNWNVAPAIHLPIFDAGRIRANLFKTRADAELSIAAYNQRVATAAAEVSDASARIRGLFTEAQRTRDQVQARQQDWKVAQLKQKQGLMDGRESRRLSIALAQTQDKDLATQFNLLQADIDLSKALGGGYGSEPSNRLSHDGRANQAPQTLKTAPASTAITATITQ